MQEEISKMLETYRYTSVYDDKLSQRLSTLITKIRIADMEEVRNKIKEKHRKWCECHIHLNNVSIKNEWDCECGLYNKAIKDNVAYLDSKIERLNDKT